MPTSGGAADKLGNRYEALWALDQLLRVVDGTAKHLTLEPLALDESRGIEFTVVEAGGLVEFWSIKRQTTEAAGWTLAVLAKDNAGRSILGDLFAHVERAPNHQAVFASTLGAGDFEELRSCALSRAMLVDRLDRSAKLKAAFYDHLVPACGGDPERARAFLLRARTHAIDEAQLRARVDFAIRKLLYHVGGAPIDTPAVRGFLAELLQENIHRPLDRDRTLGALAAHGVGLRDWAMDRSVADRVGSIREAYLAPLHSQLIGGRFLPLAGAEALLTAEGTPTSHRTLIVGGAGGGKSSTLADAVSRLVASGVPVLPVRFDQLPDGLLSTVELGRKLLLPESPAMVLPALSAGGKCVLVVDQLDAVSMASGRRAQLWSLFEELLREADRFPNMAVLVGCREFDLEHDHRMRAMKAESSGFAIVRLQPLTPEQVDAAVGDSGGILPALKAILSIPLHLSMFLSLPLDKRSGLQSTVELFDRFWTEKERRLRERLGRPAAWTQVIGRLAMWLSEHQQLSAPAHVLDEFVGDDISAMTSEHVLVLGEGRFRFFHESFFDYAYARRFAAGGGRLKELLLSGEQHLFRRAQVRQVLTFLRSKERSRYLSELGELLTDGRVRFHIKQLVFHWLAALSEPAADEWIVLQRIANTVPTLWPQVRGAVVGNTGWFDVLHAAGFFGDALGSGTPERGQEAVWMLAWPSIMRDRSDRVAELLTHHRQPNEPWSSYLRRICGGGEVYHSRAMFDMFLSLVDDGTLDCVRPGFAINDDWWTVLYSMSEKCPEYACEAVAHWFDRAISRWDPAAGHQALHDLLDRPDRTGGAVGIILRSGAGARHRYAELILPRAARLAAQLATPRDDTLDRDPLWSSRSFGDAPVFVTDALFVVLAQSLEDVALKNPALLDRLLTPFLDRPLNSMAYLILRAWSAAPERYADRIVNYLVDDPRRLKVGYSYWSTGRSPTIYTSVQAVKAASTHCSPALFGALENSIVRLTDRWEIQSRRWRGYKQLELLESLDESHLSGAGRAKLAELRSKFPNVERDPPKANGMAMTIVGSPLPADAYERMSDDHWLGALKRYAGVDRWRDSGPELSGGERELAHALEGQSAAHPRRFAALALRIPDDMPSAYFDAVVRGVANCLTKDPVAAPPIDLAQVAQLVERVHALPQRPCGKSIAWLIEKWTDRDWPESVLDAVSWYALHDPEPHKHAWKPPCAPDTSRLEADPHHVGINSTRGAIAGAVARLLFDKPEQFGRLAAAAESLSHDRSIPVRSCAIEVLLAMLNFDVPRAMRWFRECVELDSVLLETPTVGTFLHFAAYRDYQGIRPVISTLLETDASKMTEEAARQVCLVALTVDAAREDAERVRAGTAVMRKAAAAIYSRNVADGTVGFSCRCFLKPLFADPDEAVRVEAAHAFGHISQLGATDQAELLAMFLHAAPSPAALEPVVRAIEDSPVQLPDLVCRFVEKCVAAFRSDAGDIRTAGAGVAMDLSKIVIRLYAQTEDESIRVRCLDLMDEMERFNFMGLSDEMRRLDR